MTKLASPFIAIWNFILQTIEEGKKSVWPSRPEVINGTTMVVASVAAGVLVFAGFDWLLQKGLLYLLNK